MTCTWDFLLWSPSKIYAWYGSLLHVYSAVQKAFMLPSPIISKAWCSLDMWRNTNKIFFCAAFQLWFLARKVWPRCCQRARIEVFSVSPIEHIPLCKNCLAGAGTLKQVVPLPSWVSSSLGSRVILGVCWPNACLILPCKEKQFWQKS